MPHAQLRIKSSPIKLPLTSLATDGKAQMSLWSVSEFRRHFLHVLLDSHKNPTELPNVWVKKESQVKCFAQSHNWFSKPEAYAFSILAAPQK